MKHFLTLSFLVVIASGLLNAQKNSLVNSWQLYKVEVGDQIVENLKAVYIFNENGKLQASKSVDSDIMDVGTWEFNKKKNLIILTSNLDKDFNGEASLVELSKSALVFKKDQAILYFKKIDPVKSKPVSQKRHSENAVKRLDFTDADFFDENDEYKYYDDELKLPWQNPDELLMGLVNVKQLVYTCSTLQEETGEFSNKELKANVISVPSELSLSIDYIFNGYDQYNLPDDSALPPNSDYTKLLYPEVENTFRVSGAEQLTTAIGVFECTIIEYVDMDTRKKLWMINDKPGVYAKIIIDKPGDFGYYFFFELKSIRMKGENE